MKNKFSRRTVLGGAVGVAGLAGARELLGTPTVSPAELDIEAHDARVMTTAGEVDLSQFDPSKFLTDFDYGNVSQLPNGQTLREWEIVAVDKELEIAPGVFFPGWTYNGQVPGPTLRCSEGDRLRIHFSNAGSHPHTIHFHGFHPATMDGVFEVVKPGEALVYEFDGGPSGLHLYHCHSVPLKRHIHKGLYGAFIVDPPEKRPEAHEIVLVMNGFDTNFDGDNEVYAVNTVAFHYHRHPIEVKLQELVRIYLVNLLEFDLVNSLHIHGNFFEVYRTGTRLTPDEFTDTIMMCQGGTPYSGS